MSFLDQGIKLALEATTKDRAGDYEDAYQLYMQSLEYLDRARKYSKSTTDSDIIAQKMAEYMTRAESLKAFLTNQSETPASQDGTGQSAKTPGTGGDEAADEKMNATLASTILSERPNVHWDDVAGLEVAKEALKEAVILPTRFPHLFKPGVRDPWKGILLFGPPGTGKSYLAKAVATEAQATFFSVSASSLVSKWLGESEKLVKALFKMAREKSPSIVFIDEVDSLCSARGGDNEPEALRRIKTEFLIQMDGVGNDQRGVLVLGATNIPWGLDKAIRRRFQKRIYIPLPEEAARARMYKIHTKRLPTQLNPQQLAELGRCSDGYSGSDLKNVVADAVMQPIRKIQSATHYKRMRGPDPSWEPPVDEEGEVIPGSTAPVHDDLWMPCSPGDGGAVEMTFMDVDSSKLLEPPITMADFKRSLARTRPSVAPEDLGEFVDWTEKFGEEG